MIFHDVYQCLSMSDGSLGTGLFNFHVPGPAWDVAVMRPDFTSICDRFLYLGIDAIVTSWKPWPPQPIWCIPDAYLILDIFGELDWVFTTGNWEVSDTSWKPFAIQENALLSSIPAIICRIWKHILKTPPKPRFFLTPNSQVRSSGLGWLGRSENWAKSKYRQIWHLPLGQKTKVSPFSILIRTWWDTPTWL